MTKLFKTEEDAEKFVEKLRKKGVAATYRYKETKYGDRWQVVYGEAAQSFYQSHLDNMSRSAKGPHTGRKIKYTRNPSEAMQEAEDMVRRFHGREPKEVIELIDQEDYDDTLPVLGQLLELNILMPNGGSYVPIIFCRLQGSPPKPKMQLENMIQVCATTKRSGKSQGDNILFKGGNQQLDIMKLVEMGVYQELGSKGASKDICIVGPVFTIVYWTDKHHLEGPKYQEKGSAYEHQFGERKDEGEEGEMPYLCYDTRNEHMFLSGGSYEIRDEGIWN